MAKDTIISGKREFYLAAVLVFFGCSLLTAGFIVNPSGVIDGSVLTAFGEICTLVGAILGINYASNRKVEAVRRKLIEEKEGRDE